MRRRAVLGAAIAAGSALAGCIPPRRDRAGLIFLKAYPPLSLDPGIAANAGDIAVQTQLYETLTVLDSAWPDLVRPRLATSWRWSDDRRSLFLSLVQDRRFPSGARLDAHAVKASLDRVLRLARGPSAFFDWIDTVEAPAPDRVLIRLNRPYAPALQMLSQPAASIIDPAVLALGDEASVKVLAERSAGTGPFRIAEVREGEAVRLSPNPASRRRPHLPSVEFRFLPDEGVRRLLLERGDADMTDIISAAFIRRYRDLRGVKVETLPGSASLSTLFLNVRKGPMRDVGLRQAVAAAIDYENLRTRVLGGGARSVPGFLSPGSPGFDPSEPPPRRDLDRARDLIARSGYKGGPLRLMILQLGPVSEFLQSNLQEAGLSIVMQRLSPGAADAAKTAGDYDMAYDGWVCDTPDAAPMLQSLYSSASIASGVNASGYANPEVDRDIQAALAEIDPQRRAAILRRIDQTLRRDRPLVVLFSADSVLAYRRELAGARIDPLRTAFHHLDEVRRLRPSGGA